ncbi:MAG: class I SAM-dependent methyltransferase [Desulfobacter sp.]|nr:MAG: class I SAM-dependent methyltransferase [Desulfobacter sp.]
MNHSTLRYYNENAEQTAARYETADVSDLHILLKNSFKPSANLLELGCGSGRDASFMMSQGFKVIGIDGSNAMVKSALIHHPELSGCLHTIEIPKGLSAKLGPFEGVFSIATLMHLSRPDIEKTMVAIRSLLISKGLFFFSVPIQRDDTQKNEFNGKGRRFTALTQDDWLNLCKRYGFKTIQSSITKDGLGRDSIFWMNCLMEKSE